jgi:hypothetical protein
MKKLPAAIVHATFAKILMKLKKWWINSRLVKGLSSK